MTIMSFILAHCTYNLFIAALLINTDHTERLRLMISNITCSVLQII
jgi:hypothetical protein